MLWLSCRWVVDMHSLCHKDEIIDDARQITVDEWRGIQKELLCGDDEMEIAQKLIIKEPAVTENGGGMPQAMRKPVSKKTVGSVGSSFVVGCTDRQVFVNRNTPVSTSDFFAKMLRDKKKRLHL